MMYSISGIRRAGVSVQLLVGWPITALQSITRPNDIHLQFDLDANGRVMQFRKSARWQFYGSSHHPRRVIFGLPKTGTGSGSVFLAK